MKNILVLCTGNSCRSQLAEGYLKYFAGDKAFERIMIRPAAFWEERSVDMLLGQRVETVDAAAHSVTTSDGAVISYGHMI